MSLYVLSRFILKNNKKYVVLQSEKNTCSNSSITRKNISV